MAIEKSTLKNFIEGNMLLEKKKKKSKKKKKRKADGIRKGTGGLDDGWYTTGMPGGSSGSDGGGGVGESLIFEILAGITPASFSANMNSVTAYSKNTNNKDAGMTTYPSDDPNDWEWSEEEPEQKINKVDQARQIFQAMYNQPNVKRAEIINAFMKDVGTSNSTSVSYYTRFLDEFGLSSKDGAESLGQGTGMGGGMGDPSKQGTDGEETVNQEPEEKPEMEEFDDPNRAGIIRVVPNAHLVYKRVETSGTFEELWIYNLHDSMHDELDIRRDILAGTDIQKNKTKSPDRSQSYTIATMGNAQLLHILGMPN